MVLSIFCSIKGFLAATVTPVRFLARGISSIVLRVTLAFDQESRIKEEGQSYNAKIGFDYFANKKTTFGAVFTGYYNPGLFSNQSDVLIYDANYYLLSNTLAKTSNDREWKNFSTNVNFRHLLDTTGQELTADVDYLTYRTTNSQYLVNVILSL